MATLTASKAFDMSKIGDTVDEKSLTVSSTRIVTGDSKGSSYIVTGSGLTWNAADSGPRGTVTGIEFKTGGSTLYKITGSGFFDPSFNGYDDGYKIGSDIGTLYGMNAEVAWWLRGNDTINGSSGNDKLRGYNGNDIVHGNGGNDVVTGQKGDDKLYGDAGNDTLKGGIGTNLLDGGAGTDTADYSWAEKGVTVSLAVTKAQTVFSSGPIDTITGVENLTGSAYADKLTGNSGINTLTGGAGNDILNGGSGADVLVGGTGNDVYVVDNSKDTVTEAANAGTDTVQSSVSWTLGANVERLTLTGSSAVNGTGNTLANILTGNTAANSLNGGSGNDTINGGLGNDMLIGGSGKDNFVFNTKLGSANIDTIKDFSHADDTIQLENAIFAKLSKTGTLSSANFYASTSGKAHDTNDYVVYDTDTGKLFYDADGSGSGKAVQFAVIGSHPAINASDFVVI